MISRRRLGLRARVTLIYALGALLLSSTVAASSFLLTQRRLLSETERTAQSQFFRNIRDLRRGLQVAEISDDQTSVVQDDAAVEDDTDVPAVSVPTTLAPSTTRFFPATTTTWLPSNIPAVDKELTPPTTLPNSATMSSLLGETFGAVPTPVGETPVIDVPPTPQDPISVILNGLQRPNGAASLLVLPPGSDGGGVRPFSLSGLQPTSIPDDLRSMVEAGEPARRRFDSTGGDPQLALGIQLPEYDAEYFELVPLTDLQGTLNSLRNILFGVALAASIGGAGLGYYSAYRAVQPLNRVSAAAQAISGGDFETRLDDQIDPDLSKLTTSFNQMVEALQARIERDEQFASDVSHELRSPLMTLTASVGVLEGRRKDLPAPAQQAVDLLGKDLRRFRRLVEDLLEISRMDVGAVQLDRSPVYVREFLRFVIAQSRAAGINVTCAIPDADLMIDVDKRRMAQAITNLIDNAIKYAGGATAISFARHDDRVHIYVDDEGPGVQLADRVRIFDRFTRAGADAGRRDIAKGVGLGLSLVKEHIRMHDGTVWVTDRPDGLPGARFVIDMPIDDTEMGDEEMAT
ncbi:MAG: HAMP domain-containing sensor histidine kinase [Acidimicrobiales bacterium]